MDTKLDIYIDKYTEIANIIHTKDGHIIIRYIESLSNIDYIKSANNEEILTSELQNEDKPIDDSFSDFLEDNESSNSDSNSYIDTVILDTEIIDLYKEANSVCSNSETDN